MKLERWALAAEIIGGIAIVLSLIFVGIQVRQNSDAHIQTTTESVVGEYNTTTRVLAENAELACIYVRGAQNFHELPGPERVRFSAYMLSNMKALEQMHNLMLEGAINADTWNGFEGLMIEAMQLPGIQQWWQIREHWHGIRFQNYVNAMIQDSPSQSAPVVYDDSACTVSSNN